MTTSPGRATSTGANAAKRTDSPCAVAGNGAPSNGTSSSNGTSQSSDSGRVDKRMAGAPHGVVSNGV